MSDEESNVSRAGLKMESSLKKRLKRSSRFSSCPLSTPISSNKRSSIDNICRTPKLQIQFNSELDEKCISYDKEKIEKCDSKEELWKMYSNLKTLDVEADEKLRKLRLVQQHQNKNTPEHLTSLIYKWLNTGQNAIKKLYEVLQEPKPQDISSLMGQLQIDTDLVKYNAEADRFI